MLEPDQKLVLQDASVVGGTFWVGALRRGLRSESSGPRSLRCTPSSARGSYGVSARRRSPATSPTRFQHVLVRDVAYAQIPRAPRSEKHRLTAEWIEGLVRSEEQAEMLAHHYGAALELARAARVDASCARGAGTTRLRRRRRPRRGAERVRRSDPAVRASPRALARGRSRPRSATPPSRTRGAHRGGSDAHRSVRRGARCTSCRGTPGGCCRGRDARRTCAPLRRAWERSSRARTVGRRTARRKPADSYDDLRGRKSRSPAHRRLSRARAGDRDRHRGSCGCEAARPTGARGARAEHSRNRAGP